jgi:hypothetical protein
MRKTDDYLLRQTARLINYRGLQRGEQFIGPAGELDIAAAIYQAANPHDLPTVFLTDEAEALALIHACPQTMSAVRWLSQSLDTEPPVTDGRPDHVEHVCHWAMTPPIGETSPPSEAQVVGRLLRAADEADAHTTRNAA